MNGQSLDCARSSSRAACLSARSLHWVRLRKAPHQFGHPFLRHLQVGKNPFVLLVEPHAPVTFLAPARRAGRGDLVGGMHAQIFLGRDQREGLLVVIGLAHEEIEELRPFIPPVAEQFRVVRRQHQRRAIQDAGQLLDLRHARVEKMPGMLGRHPPAPRRGRRSACPARPGDAEILDAGEAAMVRRRQVRPHVVEVQVEPDVAVEIAVARVAGIAFVLAPDLAGGFQVAPEGGDAVAA